MCLHLTSRKIDRFKDLVFHCRVVNGRVDFTRNLPFFVGLEFLFHELNPLLFTLRINNFFVHFIYLFIYIFGLKFHRRICYQKVIQSTYLIIEFGIMFDIF